MWQKVEKFNGAEYFRKALYLIYADKCVFHTRLMRFPYLIESMVRRGLKYQLYQVRDNSKISSLLLPVTKMWHVLICLVSANETELAFFRKADYDTFKVNPQTVW
uniref:Uncharacterized protein n=1 Tax=Neogobius melanostomus TaxID=47308 RepID=A0A8C6WYS9_9GOBI